MPPIVYAIILCLLPVSELRGGIPYAIANKVNPFLAIVLCFLANLLVIPIVFFFLDNLHHYFLRINLYKRTFNRFIEGRRKRAKKYIEKYGYWGLIFFVAIPFPATGAYTGTLIAWLFGMKRKKASLVIVLGVLIAAIIVSTAVLLGIETLRFFVK